MEKLTSPLFIRLTHSQRLKAVILSETYQFGSLANWES